VSKKRREWVRLGDAYVDVLSINAIGANMVKSWTRAGGLASPIVPCEYSFEIPCDGGRLFFMRPADKKSELEEFRDKLVNALNLRDLK
jgi:hypothetical protein